LEGWPPAHLSPRTGQAHQGGQFGVAEIADPGLALADYGLCQGALGLEELSHPVFEGAFAHETVDLHRSPLADAVRPVARLVLHGRFHQRS